MATSLEMRMCRHCELEFFTSRPAQNLSLLVPWLNWMDEKSAVMCLWLDRLNDPRIQRYIGGQK